MGAQHVKTVLGPEQMNVREITQMPVSTRIRTPTPEPPPEEDVDETLGDEDSHEEGEANGIDEPEIKKMKIYKLPACVPLQVDENGSEVRVRIPDPLPPQKSGDFDISLVRIWLLIGVL